LFLYVSTLLFIVYKTQHIKTLITLILKFKRIYIGKRLCIYYLSIHLKKNTYLYKLKYSKIVKTINRNWYCYQEFYLMVPHISSLNIMSVIIIILLNSLTTTFPSPPNPGDQDSTAIRDFVPWLEGRPHLHLEM